MTYTAEELQKLRCWEIHFWNSEILRAIPAQAAVALYAKKNNLDYFEIGTNLYSPKDIRRIVRDERFLLDRNVKTKTLDEKLRAFLDLPYYTKLIESKSFDQKLLPTFSPLLPGFPVS